MFNDLNVVGKKSLQIKFLNYLSHYLKNHLRCFSYLIYMNSCTLHQTC